VKPYPKYKNSGIEWLGDIPDEWNIEKPTRIFRLVKGFNAATLTKEYISENQGEYPVYSGQTEDDGLMGSIEWYDFDFENPVVFITTVGAKAMTTRIVRGRFSLSQNCALAIPVNSMLDAKFFEPTFQRLFDYEKGSISLIMQPSLRFEDFNHFKVPYPSTFEQQAIASFLDRETSRIDALIEKKERLIELLKEKRIALITQAVTKGLDPNVPMKDSGIEWLGEVPEHWEIKRIKHITTRIQTGCTPPTSNEQYYEDGTIQWFGPGSFTEDLYLFDPVKIINESSVADGVARLFEKGSIMMVGIGATIGKIAQIKEPSSCNQQITVVTLQRSECDPDYYTYLLKTIETTIRGIAPSATLAIFDQGKIGSLSVLKPPLFEQVQVAEFLSDKLSVLEHMMSTISGSIRLLREYRSSLIHHAVTGKIDLRGYDAKAQ